MFFTSWQRTKLFRNAMARRQAGFRAGSTCVFNDTTVSNNSVPGDVDYGSANAKYQSSTGYDLATGLGSVNVANLLNAWSSAVFNPTFTTASFTPVTGVHGEAININVSVGGNNGGKPTGSVRILQNVSTFDSGRFVPPILTLDASSSATATTNLLLGGSYPISAHYVGDGTYAASDSTPVMMNIQPEPSTTSYFPVCEGREWQRYSLRGRYLRHRILCKSSCHGEIRVRACQPFSVDFYDGGVIFTGATFRSNGSRNIGTDLLFRPAIIPLASRYIGDRSFNPSVSSAIPFTITQASSTTTLSSEAHSARRDAMTAIVGRQEP